jgi:predicted GTPase
MDGFVDFFRRVQTPYYEEARTKFGFDTLLDDLRSVYTQSAKVIFVDKTDKELTMGKST